jgi:hypothetical protein
MNNSIYPQLVPRSSACVPPPVITGFAFEPETACELGAFHASATWGSKPRLISSVLRTGPRSCGFGPWAVPSHLVSRRHPAVERC